MAWPDWPWPPPLNLRQIFATVRDNWQREQEVHPDMSEWLSAAFDRATVTTSVTYSLVRVLHFLARKPVMWSCKAWWLCRRTSVEISGNRWLKWGGQGGSTPCSDLSPSCNSMSLWGPLIESEPTLFNTEQQLLFSFSRKK